MTSFDEAATMRKVYGRLMPLLFAMMFFNYLDRINIGFAALDMNKQLGFSPAVFGFAGSIFFFGYMLLEVPNITRSILEIPTTAVPQKHGISPRLQLSALQ